MAHTILLDSTVSEGVTDRLLYTAFTEQKSWVDAEEFCVKEGGHLASVHSIEQK